MCYYTKQTAEAQTLEKRFKASMEHIKNEYEPRDIFNGFGHPKTPVISNVTREEIQLFEWGLLPTWSKDRAYQRNTLNAKIETVTKLPSYRSYVKNRCLVLVDGFYEWQWLDPAGKKKQKYLITQPDREPFALAGIWSPWTDNEKGDTIMTYSIVTTAANKLMEEIHNNKKRMPVVLTKKNEEDWLAGKPVEDFATPDVDLSAMEI